MMFSGEQMTCFECGLSQVSDPNIESGWFRVTVGGIRGKYVCPGCMAGDSKCQNCDRYYHPDYKQCPWCKQQASKQHRGFGK